MQKKSLFLVLLVGFSAIGHAQFVFPKPEYNLPEPGLYEEDPFIVKYRREFFSVFRGDFKRFEKAYAEIEEMVKKNPKDARATVWLGNGQTVKAGLLANTGKKEEAAKLLASSRKVLDRAVELRPTDPNIYMMRAATLFIQGQYFPADQIPKENWEKLRDDCNRFIAFLGPDRIKRVSIHVRGEAFGELGIAYVKLGDKANAKKAFQQVIALDPNTDYEKRAKKEIEKLG